jgi:hypothetical protein
VVVAVAVVPGDWFAEGEGAAVAAAVAAVALGDTAAVVEEAAEVAAARNGRAVAVSMAEPRAAEP